MCKSVSWWQPLPYIQLKQKDFANTCNFFEIVRLKLLSYQLMHRFSKWCHLPDPMWLVPLCIRIEIYQYYSNNADLTFLLCHTIGLNVLLDSQNS